MPILSYVFIFLCIELTHGFRYSRLASNSYVAIKKTQTSYPPASTSGVTEVTVPLCLVFCRAADETKAFVCAKHAFCQRSHIPGTDNVPVARTTRVGAQRRHICVEYCINSGCPGSWCVNQAVLEFAGIFLPLPPVCWDQRVAPSSLPCFFFSFKYNTRLMY